LEHVLNGPFAFSPREEAAARDVTPRDGVYPVVVGPRYSPRALSGGCRSGGQQGERYEYAGESDQRLPSARRGLDTPYLRPSLIHRLTNSPTAMATSAKPTSDRSWDGSSLHNPRCTWGAATAFALTRCRPAPEADLLYCEPQRPAVRHASMMDHNQTASSAHSGARRAAPGRTTARGSVGVARPASQLKARPTARPITPFTG